MGKEEEYLEAFGGERSEESEEAYADSAALPCPSMGDAPVVLQSSMKGGY